jgi:hypothetical protein
MISRMKLQTKQRIALISIFSIGGMYVILVDFSRLRLITFTERQ